MRPDNLLQTGWNHKGFIWLAVGPKRYGATATVGRTLTCLRDRDRQRAKYGMAGGHSILRSLRNAPLLFKINVVIAVTFLAVILSVTMFTASRAKERLLQQAEEQTRDIATFYFDSLNTMMLTGTMDQRTVLRNKILRRPGIKAARVIRGAPVNSQFGQGYPEEQAMDELDERVLQGEEIVKVETGSEGRAVTVLTPFRATENTRGVNCLQCHQVTSGSINGAIRVSFSLAEMDAIVEREFWLELLANLVLLGGGLVAVNLLLRNWITRPLGELMSVVQRRATGDVSALVRVVHSDEIGQLGLAFNDMSQRVNEFAVREHDAAESLRTKVDILLDVVSRAARGDLTGQVRFGGDDAIGELAQVIQIMINNLRLLLKEKHDTVEDLQRRVDRILAVVTKAAEGDLTGKVDMKGDDAIGRLATGVQSMIESLNQLVSQVQASGIQVTSSATEMAATAKEQTATVAQQAATVNEIASTSAQISATARSLFETMNEVASLSERTTDVAEHGQDGLHEMEDTMRRVVEVSSAIASKLETLREKAASINTVVTTITKVADQTNLLSLNAAIEAEKAGEHGLGFAVVATEIRRLADQTAVASYDIEQLVQKMQLAVSASVMGVEKFSAEVRNSAEEVHKVSTQLTRIIEQIRDLTPRFESVREGMQFQTQGAEQIKHSISSLNESAHQTVASLRHSTAALDRLNEAAQLLQRGVSRFKVAKRLPPA